MARTSVASQEQFSKISAQSLSVGKISVPYTAIQNRAQITDLANDLGMRFGTERIMTQSLYLLPNEAGLNGEQVYSVINDKYDQIRFVGTGWVSINDSSGAGVISNIANDYIEITFYGTGLNLLNAYTVSTSDIRVSVDGGAEGSNILGASVSSVLGGRNYAINNVVNVISGLSMGLHTVKLRLNNTTVSRFYGFETISESNVLNIRPGTLLANAQKFNLSAASTPAYASGFESGILGTKGGRVLAYIKADGTISKAATPVDTSAAYLTSANHANEEIIRNYSWKEFTAGRSDDLSTIVSTGFANKSFTLDDNTTSLLVNSHQESVVGYIRANGLATEFMSFTFIGTGLDVVRKDSLAAGTTNLDIYIDGAFVGTMGNAGNTNTLTTKICSGLPYGSHTITFYYNANPTTVPQFATFKVYGPKKPTLPSNALEIGEYCILGNYSKASVYAVGNSRPIGTTSQGVIRKMGTRELMYVGTGWSFSGAAGNPNFLSGNNIATGTNGDYVEITFIGTGIEFMGYYAGAATHTYTLDGSTNLSGFTTSFTPSSSLTGKTWTPSAGTLTGTPSGSAPYGFTSITGLTYGKHTLRVTNTSGTAFYVDTFDIVTPVHFPKANIGFDIQNTMLIGNCAIGDLRERKQLLEIQRTFHRHKVLPHLQQLQVQLIFQPQI